MGDAVAARGYRVSRTRLPRHQGGYRLRQPRKGEAVTASGTRLYR